VSNISIIPAAADIEFFDAIEIDEREDTGEIRIGYAGTKTHGEDIKLVEDALVRLLDAYPTVWVESIGQVLPRLSDHARYRQFDEIDGIRPFARFLHARNWTIAIAPLAATAFNEGKSDNKYRMHASARIPGIYSDLKPYETVVDGQTGLLVDEPTTGAWFSALERLVLDPDLRGTIVANALADVRSKHAMVQVTARFHDLLRSVAEVPTVMVSGGRAATLPGGLRSLDGGRTIFVRQAESNRLADRDLDWADILVIAMTDDDTYHPLLSRARSAGCRIVALYEVAANDGAPRGPGFSRNAIVAASDILILRQPSSGTTRAVSVFAQNLAEIYASSNGAGDWQARLAGMIDDRAFGSIARDVVRTDFAVQGEDDLPVWRHVFRCMGLSVMMPPIAQRAERS
jgi:hypothetical protein